MFTVRCGNGYKYIMEYKKYKRIVEIPKTAEITFFLFPPQYMRAKGKGNPRDMFQGFQNGPSQVPEPL